MSTTLFVSVADVATRMQLQADLEGVSDLIQSALTGAQLHIESVLGTDLEIKQQDCRFLLDSDAFSGMQPNGQYKIELPSYFLRSDVEYPVTIEYASDWKMSDAQAVDATLIQIDHEKGQVYLDAETYADKYVRVRGTTGFLADAVLVAADPEAVPPVAEVRGPEAIPDWLYESILVYVGVIFDVGQTTKRSAEASDLYRRAGDHAMSVLAPKMRKRGFVIRPFNS